MVTLRVKQALSVTWIEAGTVDECYSAFQRWFQRPMSHEEELWLVNFAWRFNEAMIRPQHGRYLN